MAPRESFEKCHQRRCETGRNEEKIEWKSSEVNTRAVSRGQNKLIGKFKIAAGDYYQYQGVGYGVCKLPWFYKWNIGALKDLFPTREQSDR